MECPNCKMINPPEAARCGCGYDFVSRSLPALGFSKNQPRYARFVSFFLASVVMSSLLVLAFFRAVAKGQNPNVFVVIVATALTILLARSAYGEWEKIQTCDHDGLFKRRKRRVLVTSTVIVVLFWTTSGLAGRTIGQSGSATQHTTADIDIMNTLGSRISKARNSVENTIPAYLQMYASIEADVRQLELVLQRLQSELPAYKARFPAAAGHTDKSISNVNTAIHRITLLKKQIEVAKEIAASAESGQNALWQREMRPLLLEEDEIDKPR